MTDFDLIVLGLGPGGEDIAGSMAEAGWAVLGVEPRLAGGECPYFGCIPSKMMLRGAELLVEARRVNGFAGTAIVEPDFAPVHARIRDEATDNWNDQVAVDRLVGKGATFARGAGRLAGRDTDGRVLVEVAGETHRASHVVIATGTAPALPPIDGLAELRGERRRDRRTGVDQPRGGQGRDRAGLTDRARRRRDRLRAGAGVRPLRHDGYRRRAWPAGARAGGAGVV